MFKPAKILKELDAQFLLKLVSDPKTPRDRNLDSVFRNSTLFKLKKLYIIIHSTVDIYSGLQKKTKGETSSQALLV